MFSFNLMKLTVMHEIVGRTRSGKAIPHVMRFSEIDAIKEFFLKTFDIHDLLDAYATFDFLAAKAYRRRPSETSFEAHSFMASKILGPENFEQAKKAANVKTIPDLHKLALRCVNLEFR